MAMDNTTLHKRQDIQTAIANAGHTLEYLPSYSPDFNDIEPKWGQAKAIRKREGCSIEQLFAAYKI
ncbi:transposase [Nitrosomonas communis]|uniref:transposase n=1 Tax=Nitrosomonas communis TaxID=44574 RepID=UPI00210C4981|nr:transposase [Nitrosomonas communis]